MLIEKEVISPGVYWYEDQKTGLPRKMDVTAEHTKYWHQKGQEMVGDGLAIPVPYEHDFSAKPLTDAEKRKQKLLGNAGEVREYRLKDFNDPVRGLVKDALFSVVDVQDEDVKKKIGSSIRWTSPWITSFTDGNGKKWDNVIAHLALTTRPRITKQQPFSNTAAALSMASDTRIDVALATGVPPEGLCLSKAGLLGVLKKTKVLAPRYPVAFSLYSGAALGDDFPPKKKGPPKPGGDKAAPKPGAAPGGDADGDGDMDFEGEEGGPPKDSDPTNDSTVDLAPYGDPKGDVQIEEVLCDLLRALGVHCEHGGDEASFKRSLYTGAMQKIHELAGKAQNPDQPQPGQIQDPNNPKKPGQPNPLIQQEQQPMYMSLGDSIMTLEEINAITDPAMKSVALSMHNDNVKLRSEMEADRKKLAALNDNTLKEEEKKRQDRIKWLCRASPKAKARLEKLMAEPGMALSMGDGGTVVDPMGETLALLEESLSDLPKLLTTESAALAVQPHPKDGDELSQEEIDAAADSYARRMGAAPEKKVG